MSTPTPSCPPASASGTSLGLRLAVFAALSFALGRATAPIALHAGLVPVLDPVVGLAVAAVLAFGPVYAIGTWGAAAIVAAQAGPFGLGESIVLGLAPALAALAARGVVRGRREFFASLHGVGAFFLAAAVSATVAAAWTAGAFAVFGLASSESLLRPFATAWIGAATGGLLVGGTLLAARRDPFPVEDGRVRIGLALVVPIAVGLVVLASLDFLSQPMQRVLVLLALPAAFAIGALGGARAAATFALVFGAAALLTAARDLGPFRALGAGSGPFLAAAYSSVLAVVGLATAALATRTLRSEADARARREEFDLAVGDSAGGLWEWDLESDRVWFSSRFLALLGMPSGARERSGDAFTAIVHRDDLPVLEAAVREHLERGSPFEVDVRLRLADGAVGWFLVRGFAQRDADGRPVRIAGSIADASARKAGESELARLENELSVAREAAARSASEMTLFVEELARRSATDAPVRTPPQEATLPFDPPASGAIASRRLEPRSIEVLLVFAGDEEPLLRGLERLDCAVRLVRDGKAAQTELDRAPVELVLLDCGLPAMDAYATALELRTRPSLRTVPIVALSDRARPGELATCLAAGMDDLIGLPVDDEELAIALARWSGGRRIGLSSVR